MKNKRAPVSLSENNSKSFWEESILNLGLELEFPQINPRICAYYKKC